jgi:hypothetical protein
MDQGGGAPYLAIVWDAIPESASKRATHTYCLVHIIYEKGTGEDQVWNFKRSLTILHPSRHQELTFAARGSIAGVQRLTEYNFLPESL